MPTYDISKIMERLGTLQAELIHLGDMTSNEVGSIATRLDVLATELYKIEIEKYKECPCRKREPVYGQLCTDCGSMPYREPNYVASYTTPTHPGLSQELWMYADNDQAAATQFETCMSKFSATLVKVEQRTR